MIPPPVPLEPGVQQHGEWLRPVIPPPVPLHPAPPAPFPSTSSLFYVRFPLLLTLRHANTLEPVEVRFSPVSSSTVSGCGPSSHPLSLYTPPRPPHSPPLPLLSTFVFLCCSP